MHVREVDKELHAARQGILVILRSKTHARKLSFTTIRCYSNSGLNIGFGFTKAMRVTNDILLDSNFTKTFNRRNQAFSPATLESSPVRKAKYLKTHRHHADAKGTLSEFRGSDNTLRYFIKLNSDVKRCDYIYVFAPKAEQLARCVLVSKHPISGNKA
jgi:hypothetical protein